MEGGLILKDKDITIEDFEPEKKHYFRSFLVLLLIIIILTTSLFTLSFYNWKSLAEAMISNTPSVVLDSEGEIIARIGSERITKNVTFNEIPGNLKNAYVAI